MPTIIGRGGVKVEYYGKVVTISLSNDGSSITFVDGEVPEGLVDGNNKDFTLSRTPSPPMSLMLHVNGLLQQGGGNDYSVSGNVVHFTSAPTADSTLLASYRY